MVGASEDDRSPELEEHEATNDNLLEFEPTADQVSVPSDNEEVKEQFALLEEAVGRYEQAVAREEEALKREAAALKEATDQREAVSDLKAELSNQQAIIRANENDRGAADKRIAELEAKLSDMLEAGKYASQVDEDAEDRRNREVESLKGQIKTLEAEVGEKEKARQDAEAAQISFAALAEEAESELDRLREGVKGSKDSERLLAEAQRRESSGRKEAELQREAAEKFKAEAENEKRKREEADAARARSCKAS